MVVEFYLLAIRSPVGFFYAIIYLTITSFKLRYYILLAMFI
nr:MAG TPA: hypothetical protein [Caudoviricetes sp.]